MNVGEVTGQIVSEVSQVLPQRRKCERHNGRLDAAALRRAVQAAPAVLVTCLGFPNIAKRSNGEIAVTAQFAAFVVTRDTAALDRTAAASSIAGALVTLIDDNRWQREDTFDPENLRAENLFNDQLDGIGCTIWVVSWRQDLLTGEDACQEDGSFPENLYIGWSPEIGAAHKEDYRNIETGEAPPDE
jgi:phage gp37-like protein